MKILINFARLSHWFSFVRLADAAAGPHISHSRPLTSRANQLHLNIVVNTTNGLNFAYPNFSSEQGQCCVYMADTMI